MIVKMPQGQIEYAAPLTCQQVAMDMGEDVLAQAVCALVDDKVVDLSFCITQDCTLQLLDLTDERAQVVYQHSAAHLTGQAVKAVFPTAKLANGPATKDGFWYDVAFATPPDGTALARLNEEVNRIIRADLPVVREEISRTSAKALMRRFGEIYKIQRIEAMPKGQRVVLYHQGNFVDMSMGPHVAHTGRLAVVALLGITRLAGGDGRMWRIWGKAFADQNECDRWLRLMSAEGQPRQGQRKRNV